VGRACKNNGVPSFRLYLTTLMSSRWRTRGLHSAAYCGLWSVDEEKSNECHRTCKPPTSFIIYSLRKPQKKPLRGSANVGADKPDARSSVYTGGGPITYYGPESSPSSSISPGIYYIVYPRRRESPADLNRYAHLIANTRNPRKITFSPSATPPHPPNTGDRQRLHRSPHNIAITFHKSIFIFSSPV